MNAVRLHPRTVAALGLASLVGLVAFGWPLLAQPGQRTGALRGRTAALRGTSPAAARDRPRRARRGRDRLQGHRHARGARRGGRCTAPARRRCHRLLAGVPARRPRPGARSGAGSASSSAPSRCSPLPCSPEASAPGCRSRCSAQPGSGSSPAACRRPRVARRSCSSPRTVRSPGLAYGMLLDLWFWPFTTGLSTGLSFVAGDPLSENLHRFFAFWLATSLGFDIPRAIGNLVLRARGRRSGPARAAAFRPARGLRRPGRVRTRRRVADR